MKAARRQELKTNDLSVYIQDVTEYLRNNATKVTVFIILIVALVAAVAYRVHASTRTLTNGWNAYLAASRITPSEDDSQWVDDTIRHWEQVISTYDDPAIRSSSMWALVGFCRQQATSADQREVKKKLLDAAVAYCDQILAEYKNIVTLYGSALIERAVLEQDLFVLDQNMEHRALCRAYLERVLNENVFLGSPLRSEVRARLDDFDGLWTILALAEPANAPGPMEGPPVLPGESPAPAEGGADDMSPDQSTDADDESTAGEEPPAGGEDQSSDDQR